MTLVKRPEPSLYSKGSSFRITRIRSLREVSSRPEPVGSEEGGGWRSLLSAELCDIRVMSRAKVLPRDCVNLRTALTPACCGLIVDEEIFRECVKASRPMLTLGSRKALFQMWGIPPMGVKYKTGFVYDCDMKATVLRCILFDFILYYENNHSDAIL